MMSFDDIKIYLPKYLSQESTQDLFIQLKEFPCNIDGRLYTDYRQDDEQVFQGDGIRDMLIINLPSNEIRKSNAMVLSNTCDIDRRNKSFSEAKVCYAPILNLNKYAEQLMERLKDPVKVNNHIEAIQKQRVTKIFYLPKGSSLDNDSFVLLDRIINSSCEMIKLTDLKKIRLFTLSNYGLYLFLFKLSIHFTRIQEGVDRNFSCFSSAY